MVSGPTDSTWPTTAPRSGAPLAFAPGPGNCPPRLPRPAALAAAVLALFSPTVIPATKPPPASARLAMTATAMSMVLPFIESLLLVSQCLDGMEPRRAQGRVEAEDDADRRRDP